jgi:hypothetical protein
MKFETAVAHRSGFSEIGSCLVLGLILANGPLAFARTKRASGDADEAVSRKYEAFAEVSSHRGVIDDPDGYVNVRAAGRPDAPVVAKVKKDEPFSFERKEDDEWCRVRLASGKSGWMHYSRIMLFFTQKDLPEKPEKDDEIEEQARSQGIDYYGATQGAVRGDREARTKFFSVTEYADGAGAEEHNGVLSVVIHLMGDNALADFLRDQPLAFQTMVRDSLVAGDVTFPFDGFEYLASHFPRTAKILFRREIVDWPSPDGRYAIRKVFSDAMSYSDSKVTRAEVLEKASGQVLRDLTADDIGTGFRREGQVFWAPDSKRFAYVSKGQFPPPRAGERTQTTIYQRSKAAFDKLDVALNAPPGLATNLELKGAKLVRELVVPLRWATPTVLVLSTHHAYEKVDESGGLVTVGPFNYEITATIAEDGKVTADWKGVEEGK